MSGIEEFFKKYGLNYLKVTPVELISKMMDQSGLYRNDFAFFEDQYCRISEIILKFDILRSINNTNQSQLNTSEVIQRNDSPTKYDYVIQIETNQNYGRYVWTDHLWKNLNESLSEYKNRLLAITIEKETQPSYYGERSKTTYQYRNLAKFSISISKPINLDKELGHTLPFWIVKAENLIRIFPYLEQLNEEDLLLSDSRTVTNMKKLSNHEWMLSQSSFGSEGGNSNLFVVCSLPFAWKYHELYIFSQQNNEYLLMPFAKWSNNTINVFWKNIDDASLYTLELFIYYPRRYLKSLYKILTKTINRNECMASIGDLANGRYIVRVLAENRSGEVIAQSRGIEILPKEDVSLCKAWDEEIIKDIKVRGDQIGAY